MLKLVRRWLAKPKDDLDNQARPMMQAALRSLRFIIDFIVIFLQTLRSDERRVVN